MDTWINDTIEMFLKSLLLSLNVIYTALKAGQTCPIYVSNPIDLLLLVPMRPWKIQCIFAFCMGPESCESPFRRVV